MEFEWDPKKAASNLRKHGVSFEEATSVFNDPLATVYEDPDHLAREKRFLTIGTSATERLLQLWVTLMYDKLQLVGSRRQTEVCPTRDGKLTHYHCSTSPSRIEASELG